MFFVFWNILEPWKSGLGCEDVCLLWCVSQGMSAAHVPGGAKLSAVGKKCENKLTIQSLKA